VDVDGWDTQHWNRINQAVQAVQPISVAINVLPIFQLDDPWTRSVPSNVVGAQGGVSEADLPVIEAAVEFPLTKTQVNESSLSAATTAAANAARALFTGTDTLILQGGRAKLPAGLQVNVSNQPAKGLVAEAATQQTVTASTDPTGQKTSHGDNTFTEVTKGIATMNQQGHVAPFVLLLPATFFGEIHEALSGNILPVDRIRPLVTSGIFPALVPATEGLLLSVGAQVAQLCVGIDVRTECVQQASGGAYVFRVYNRWALQVPNPDGLVRLQFK
jgi:uncharacterized linocin/CFP29 family protein